MIYGTLPAFASRDQRKSRKNSIKTASLRVYSMLIVCFVPTLCVVGQNNSVLFELLCITDDQQQSKYFFYECGSELSVCIS
jgi:hypothetical protein